MNCGQCGAPMKVAAGENVFHCEYCGSYEFSDPNQDGVALLEQISPYACPTCGQALVAAIVRNVPILSCPSCRGNLIEQAKVHAILRQAPLAEWGEEDEPRPTGAAELKRELICPSCRREMETYPYGGAESVFIQGCSACGLIWLDFGELSGILRSYARMEKRSREEAEEARRWGLPW